MNVRLETLKLLEENIGGRLLDVSLGMIFLGLTPKTKATEAKINKWDYIQLKRFCTAQKSISKMKSQPTEREKIFANHISCKGLTSKKYKELIQLKSKKNSI